jgi:hypothetical protein
MLKWLLGLKHRRRRKKPGRNTVHRGKSRVFH